METYTILALGIVGYIVYTQYNKTNKTPQTPYLNTYPTGTHKFTTQVMPGPNGRPLGSVSFMNSTY